MVSLFQYSLAVSVPLLLLWAIYRFCLRTDVCFKARRFVIWSIYIAGLLLMPLIVGSHSLTSGELRETPVVLHFVSTEVLRAVRIIAGVWLTGAVIVALMTIADGLRIGKLLHQCRRIDEGDYVLHLSDQSISPFSFGRHIVMSEADYNDNAKIVIAHERGHIRYLHSVDMIVAQIVAIICWYNPAAWLLRADLRAVHEYQADSYAVYCGVDIRIYQRFLLEKAVGSKFPWIASRFNHSKIARRIAMMNGRRKGSLWSAVRYVMPIIGIVASAVVLDDPYVRAPIMAYAAMTRQEVRSNGLPPEVEIYVDGVEVSHEQFEAIPVNEIKSITVNKKDNRIDFFMSK